MKSKRLKAQAPNNIYHLKATLRDITYKYNDLIYERLFNRIHTAELHLPILRTKIHEYRYRLKSK